MTSAATRVGRQARIVSLLSSTSVHSQSELATMLADEGIDVTQATLSRDLDELGAVKLRGADGGVPVYVVPEDGSPVRGVSGGTERMSRLLAELLVSTDARSMLASTEEARWSSPVVIWPWNDPKRPRTLLTIMWRTEKDTSECTGSISHVPVT